MNRKLGTGIVIAVVFVGLFITLHSVFTKGTATGSSEQTAYNSCVSYLRNQEPTTSNLTFDSASSPACNSLTVTELANAVQAAK